MEYFVFAIVGYILTTQAFLIGVKQGRRLDTKAPVKTIVDVVKDKIESVVTPVEQVNEILDYSYEKALESVKQERLRGQ